VQSIGFVLDTFEKDGNKVGNSKRKSKRLIPVVKPKSDREVRNRIDAVKKRFEENDRRRDTAAQTLRAQEEDILIKQIRAIWNDDHNQTIPQIVAQLHLPLGYQSANKKLGQLLRATISEAEINERNLSRAEKELQRLDQEEVLRKQIRSIWNENHSQTVGQIVTRLQSVGSKNDIGLNGLSRLVRMTVPEAVASENKKQIEKDQSPAERKETPKGQKRKERKEQEKIALQRRRSAMRFKSRIFDAWSQDIKQTPEQVAKKLISQGVVNGNTLGDLVDTIRRTLLEYIRPDGRNPIAQQSQRPPTESLQARRYIDIKSKVFRSFQLLKEQPQIQISLQSVGLTANELAFAAIAPASSDQERKEALSLVKASGSDAAVSMVLLENFSKNAPTSKRRINIVYALRELGRSSEIAKLLNEHGVIEDSNSLQWSVLPPGWWNDSKYTDQITNSSKTGQVLLERLKYVDQLNPLEQWRSQEQLGSDPYWVFVFPHHVVAECPTHGNAIYIIKGTSDWRNLLNTSKADLIKGFPDRVIRIIHSGDWQSRLSRKLREK